MIDLGILDTVASRAADLDSAELRKLLNEAAKKGSAPVRQSGYRIGLEHFGPEFVRPALEDSAKAVRNWAVKALDRGK